MTARRVVVVGAGITGLVAARELAREPGLEVLCLEASGRVGGQVQTVELDGAAVDVGAEAIHLGAPHVAALVRELGLDADVVGAAPGSSVMATRKGLRPLPAGVGPTGPTRILPVLRSGILTLRGLARAGLEPVTARRRFGDDVTVGQFTAHRFGREVTDTFVDPLLGNLHGGDVHQLSLRATAPQLVEDAAGGRSMLLKNLRRRHPATPSSPRTGAPLPMFATWPQGLRRLTDALAADSAATIRTSAPVRALERTADGWRVLLDDESIECDHVLLTTPAAVSAALLHPHCPEAVELYEAVPMASVATVVLGYDRAEAQRCATLRGANGILLPSNRVRTFKALTNLTRKWPGLQSRHHLVRASVGRFGSDLAERLDDQEAVRRVSREVADLTGLAARPELSAVFRWPHSMPQLRPGHLDRVRRARAALDQVGGISVAGCSVDGLGIGSTVRSGQQAARSISTVFNQSEDS